MQTKSIVLSSLFTLVLILFWLLEVLRTHQRKPCICRCQRLNLLYRLVVAAQE
jgi:hypothetical protein